ncbi:hypothetical protein D3C87_1707840 [compost metagenome]
MTFLDQSAKTDITNALSIGFKNIIETKFVHCKGHPLEVEFGKIDELGNFFTVNCSHCYGFDSVFSKSPGFKDGRPVFCASDKWETGMKRAEVQTYES